MLSPRVPRSIMRTSRAERTDVALTLLEGAIPADLGGHLFVVAPASTVDPAPPGRRTTLFVGDGLICRLDLGSTIRFTTRLARTHDFVADELTATEPALSTFRFVDAGLVRLGLLGTRDFANTAFVPMRHGADPTRLALTYDAGRPVEIDPVTLAVSTPIGARDEWRAEALADALFPIVLSPAHPAYDPHTGDLFTLNYGRGAGNFAATIPLAHLLSRLPFAIERTLDRLASVAGIEAAYRWLLRHLERITTAIDRRLEAIADEWLPFVPDTFTDLVRWDGSGALERWRLVLPDDSEVSIVQSVHQVAVTRDHVVILETGFKIGLQSAFNDPVPRTDTLDRLLRAILTRPQIASTVFYVVSRADLATPLPPGDDGMRRVRCRRVELPIEADHFLADFDDAGGHITVHVAHAPATDLSEWLRPYDVSAYDLRPVPADLVGMLAVGAMDVGRFGRYVIDAARGDVIESETLADDRVGWAIALYTGAALNTDAPPPERVESLYWCTAGYFPELLTDFVHDLYERYPHRLTPLSAIRDMGTGGRPSAIMRLDTQPLAIADRYELPAGVMAGSMQHVPGGTGGYLVGTVFTDARTELWILDAADLAAGPIAKLEGLELGFSLHTAWLPSVAPRVAPYRVSARGELEDAARALSDPLADAFEARLYPRFE